MTASNMTDSYGNLVSGPGKSTLKANPACVAWLATHPEWAPVPGARHYEASHRGNGVRSLDRISNGRKLTGKVLAVSVSGTSDYPKTRIVRDEGTRWTSEVHAFVLLAHAGPCPDGQETLHGPGGPLDSRYCGCDTGACAEGNLRYGTHAVNVGETIAAGRAVRPATFPCINHERCGGMVVNEGRRCLRCATEVARAATAMYRAGIDEETAARRLGYANPVWVRRLAVKYGGHDPAVRVMRRSWPHRAMATVRYRLKIGIGDTT